MRRKDDIFILKDNIFFTNFFMKKNFAWYTIIEMMVAVAIIVVLSLSLAKFDIVSILSLQKKSIFTNRIIWAIEVTRNSFMSGKLVMTSQTPWYSWKLDLPVNTSSSNIYVRYKVSAASAWVIDTRQTLKVEQFEKIDSIICKKIDGTTSTVNTTGTYLWIVFEPGKIWFEWCPDANFRSIEITTSFKWQTKKIFFNGMSGVVENVQ